MLKLEFEIGLNNASSTFNNEFSTADVCATHHISIVATANLKVSGGMSSFNDLSKYSLLNMKTNGKIKSFLIDFINRDHSLTCIILVESVGKMWPKRHLSKTITM
jgi:hypothetical protein